MKLGRRTVLDAAGNPVCYTFESLARYGKSPAYMSSGNYVKC